MSTTPTLREMKWPQVKPTFEDFVAAGQTQNQKGQSTAGMHFHAKTAQLPESLKINKGTLHKTFKPAGPASNQRSAAAAAFLTCIRKDYERCGMAWAGL